MITGIRAIRSLMTNESLVSMKGRSSSAAATTKYEAEANKRRLAKIAIVAITGPSTRAAMFT